MHSCAIQSRLATNRPVFFTEWEYAAHRLSAIQQGILLTGETAGKIKSCLEEMNLLNASERMLMLIRILQQIGTTTDLIPIGLQETAFNGITKTCNACN